MDFSRSRPPGNVDMTGVSDEGAAVYDLIREEIVGGTLEANDRLVVNDLAERHRSNANAVREALQLLRAQGFVVIAHNKGAKVRPIDQDFVRDIHEIGVLVEPVMMRWFVGMARTEDIAELERLQAAMEANNFEDVILHSGLDNQFHRLMYERHYNAVAAEMWWKHREMMRALTRRYNVTLARRAQAMREHRELIALVKQGDAEKAAALIAQHIEGAGRHFLEQMRSSGAARAS